MPQHIIIPINVSTVGLAQISPQVGIAPTTSYQVWQTYDQKSCILAFCPKETSMYNSFDIRKKKVV